MVERQNRLDALHDAIVSLDFDEAVCLSERFDQETETEIREQPMKLRDRSVELDCPGEDAQRQDGSRRRAAGATLSADDLEGVTH